MVAIPPVERFEKERSATTAMGRTVKRKREKKKPVLRKTIRKPARKEPVKKTTRKQARKKPVKKTAQKQSGWKVKTAASKRPLRRSRPLDEGMRARAQARNPASKPSRRSRELKEWDFPLPKQTRQSGVPSIRVPPPNTRYWVT